jgi:hypothetical protein
MMSQQEKDKLVQQILEIAPEHADEHVLQTETVSELEQIYRQAVLAEIETLREQRIRAQAEAAAARAIYQLNQHQAREPQRKAQAEARLKEDRKTFEDAAKTLHSFGINEANFNVTRQTLGEGFSVQAIQEMLIANGAIVSPPTQEELNQWEQERIAARNEFLLEADPGTLRTAAKQEVEQKRVAMQQEQARREDEARKQRDEARGYPPLPQVWNNALLDSHFIRKCSTETLKDLIRRFGAHQVTGALRNRN